MIDTILTLEEGTMERIQGQRFTIDAEKYAEAMASLIGSAVVRFDEVKMRETLLDSQRWEAADHQRWLDTASAAVIAEWLADRYERKPAR